MASSDRASPPLSPRLSPSSVSPSAAVQRHQPQVPSGLRQAHMPPPSPEDRHQFLTQTDGQLPEVDDDRGRTLPHVTDHGLSHEDTGATTPVEADLEQHSDHADARTALLYPGYKYKIPDCGERDCPHGTFSPRPRRRLDGKGYGSFAPSIAPSLDGSERSRDWDGTRDGVNGTVYGAPRRVYRGDFVDGGLGGVVEEGWERVKDISLMSVLSYFPVTRWAPQYRWSYLQGDLVAALTMASFYIPMALSYASNLGHIPPINGLYSFVFPPLIYALLGSCPQMVVGPEAAGSLLTGSVVRQAIDAGHHSDDDGGLSARVAGMVTGLAGGIILAAGLCRLGFLDSVLSRPFLRGFISAIGIVILVDQLIPEMGLDTAAAHSQSASHGSSLDKILFLFRHGSEAHALTAALSFSTIAVVLVMREMKHRLQPRMPWVAYVPDRFIVVVLTAVATWRFGWENRGLDILGDIKSKGTAFKPEWPFARNNFQHVDDALGTALVIAMLGFFESSVAAKSLGSGAAPKRKGKDDREEDESEQQSPDGLAGMRVSANRELVALGVANLIGGIFMGLPAFGGYGRSKVNASTGGKTPMSSVFLSIIAIICVLFLLPYFYYIPKGVLSAMISVVAYSLIEEAPHDVMFFWRISGYNELLLMVLIFLTTFFWNLRVGILVGIGLSLLRLLKHSTRPRIQILGRVPGTGGGRGRGGESVFESAESEQVEFVPHCLIIKIPEPLTFANTGSLKDRLHRLEDRIAAPQASDAPRRHSHFRASSQHLRSHAQNIIFDVHGVTSLDPAACQVLLEIVRDYVERGTRVLFCRVPSKRSEVYRLMRVSGIMALCGGEEEGFVSSVDEALRRTEDGREWEETVVDEEAMVEGGTQTELGEDGAPGR